VVEYETDSPCSPEAPVPLPITAAEIAPRLATGAFILNSGLGKRSADGATAAGLHGFASSTYPFLKKVDAATFAKALSTGEIVLGATLLAPFVPGVVAGAGLTAFAAGLLGLYLKTPGMTKEGASIAPTQEGLPIAKDVWMLGIGLGLVTQGLTGRGESTRARRQEKARKAAAKASAKSSAEASKRARRAKRSLSR
jgi:hypothetical protein